MQSTTSGFVGCLDVPHLRKDVSLLAEWHQARSFRGWLFRRSGRVFLGLGIGDLIASVNVLVRAGTVRRQMGIVHRWDYKIVREALA